MSPTNDRTGVHQGACTAGPRMDVEEANRSCAPWLVAVSGVAASWGERRVFVGDTGDWRGVRWDGLEFVSGFVFSTCCGQEAGERRVIACTV